MAYCPFQSGPMFNSDGAFTGMHQEICPESSLCQVWDSTNERCGAKVSDTIKNDGINENNTLITMLENVLGKQSEKDEGNSLLKYLQDIIGKHEEKNEASNGKTLLTLENHKHESHSHPTPHECSEIPVGCGRTSTGSSRSTILIGEFHGNEDLDNNGLVYGRDFKIEDDSEKPPVLRSIENSQDWIEPTTTMTWSDYMGE